MSKLLHITGFLRLCCSGPANTKNPVRLDLHWWCRWKPSSSWGLREEGRRTSSPEGLPPATQTQGKHTKSLTDHADWWRTGCWYCTLFMSCTWVNSCSNVCVVYSLSPGKKAGYLKPEMQGPVTWFSVVVAVSLGILLPVVVVGFFPLGTGMADSFILPQNEL